MSTRGVVDIVFLLDASDSMRPCIEGVRQHLGDFIRGLESGGQQRMDYRLDFLAHCCDQSGGPFMLRSLRHTGADILPALYRPGKPHTFFTTSAEELRLALQQVQVAGDEATLVALDFALDFPWRPRSTCHRVVICLTDEPLETGALVAEQRARLSQIIDKIQALGVMLFLVGPPSDAYSVLAEADKSEYQEIDATGDGLRTVDFGKVLAFIGKTISMASQTAGEERGVQRALFGQDSWGATDASISGR
ncbi:MAG: hypothetical protein U0835_23285 [Isosphaeraceae bacterium]